MQDTLSAWVVARCCVTQGVPCCLGAMMADVPPSCLSARLVSWNLACERTLWPGALYGAHPCKAKGPCLCLGHW